MILAHQRSRSARGGGLVRREASPIFTEQKQTFREKKLQRTPNSDDYCNVDPSRALPTGVVTFLLTDVQGSTRLWEREPDAMRKALARHDAIVSTCVKRQHGHVVKSKGEGDSVFAVFSHVRNAVTAALVIQ